MTNRELSIVLRLKDEATKRLQGVRGSLQRFSNAWKKNWLAITAAITAGIIAVRKAWESVRLAVQAEQQAAAFRQLAASYGANADELLRQLRRVSVGAIAQADLIQAAGRAILLGLAPERLPELLEIARASARVTGDSMVKSFDDISTGIGRQSRMILDNLGIIVKAESAYKNYAVSIGKTADELTEAERRQAFFNAVLEAGQDTMRRVNTEFVTNAERIQQMQALWRQFAENVGRFLVTLANLVASGFLIVVQTIQRGIEGLLQVTASALAKVAEMAARLERLPLVGEKLRGVSAALSDLGVGAGELAGTFQASREQIQGWVDQFIAGAASISGAIQDPVIPGLKRMGAAVEEVEEKAQQSFKFMETFASNTATAMASSMSDFFFSVFTREVRSAREIFAAFGRSMLRILAELIARAILFKVILKGFAAIPGPIGGIAQTLQGVAQVKHQGGPVLPSFQSGGEVPILAQPGEFVVRRSSAQKNRGLLERINAGEAGASQPIVQQFFINATDADSFKAKLQQNADLIEAMFQRAMRRNSGTMREAVHLA